MNKQNNPITLQLYSPNSIIQQFNIQSFIPQHLKNMLISQQLLLSTQQKNKKQSITQQQKNIAQALFYDKQYMFKNNSAATNDFNLYNLKCNVYLQQRYRQIYLKYLIKSQNKQNLKTFIIPIYLTITIDGISGIQWGQDILITDLPMKYKKFKVMNISQNVDSKSYTTTLKCLSVTQ